MSNIKPMNRACSNCTKVEICSPFRSAKSFEQGFSEQWNDVAKLPFPAELLATNCKHYESPHENSKFSKFTAEELLILTDIKATTDKEVDLLQLAGLELARRHAEAKKNEVTV